MARVVQYAETGPAEVLEVVEVPDPVPGPGEVLVEVRAAGVNPIEWKLRSGLRPSPPIREPRRLGADGAGVVAAVGENVDDWAVGDEVIVSGATGTYATHVVVPRQNLVAKPAALDFEQAAALGIPVATAHQALASLDVRRGHTLVVHGGSGGVGQAAIQLGRHLGARVIATASPANHDRLRELGAEPVAYGDGLLERIQELAPEGVDRVLDAAGTDEALAASLALVDDPQHVGTIVVGPKAPELGIQAWSGGAPWPLTPEQLRLREDAVPVVADLVVRGVFEVEVSRRFALDDVVAAAKESEAGHTRGKIVLLP
ncbi:NADPH:quinone reductase-like Zn-dependent oxidoreductase [Nocardioides zeae]|uniref:NADPH:quinone reductase-like Zn-dependent oxidoreductase n=1 Tax=Nocardioides zeae TaxID=1457234 RepID=A0ACC6INP5_9ACTN|nr:NADP-dependent oxidoreductase [Nocardioides zeae]MDR6173395.1 NADPH:quinone reductase-like Zn-dependent oxidoreductase [Nocardioides zeae]MDR6212260.1 NADPH:quinone reductase-like Zn-dependent oxidoreductase [Nocardioides zeae]